MTQVTLDTIVRSGTEQPTSRVIRMNAMALGTVLGLLAGFGLFIATNYLVLKGGDVVGPHLALLGQVFLGYQVTFAGSLIGFAWAFFVFWAAGYFGARIYNGVAHRGRQS